jgi:hypothetical protein
MSVAIPAMRAARPRRRRRAVTLTAAERRIASARLLAVPCGWFGVDDTRHGNGTLFAGT